MSQPNVGFWKIITDKAVTIVLVAAVVITLTLALWYTWS